MFLLSLAVAILTLGYTYLYFFFQVRKVAVRTSTELDCTGSRLVPGMALVKGQIPQDFRCRLERIRRQTASGTTSPIIILGGFTGEAPVSEAEAGQKWLVERGVPEELIIVEDKSTDTLENLKAAREALSRLQGRDRGVIVSSRYHLARCAALAEGLDLRHSLCAAEDDFTVTLSTLARMTHEALLLNWFYCGRAYAKLTGNMAILHRIT